MTSWLNPNAKALVRAADNDPYGVAVPSAGRELDALVERDVMGIVWDKGRCRVCGWPLVSEGRPMGCTPDNCSMRPAPKRRADEPARYSTDIAAAWRVVEAIAARGYHWKINTPFMPDQQYHAGFTEQGVTGWNGYPDYRDSGESAPLAICRAALRLAITNPPRASGSSDRE